MLFRFLIINMDLEKEIILAVKAKRDAAAFGELSDAP